MSKVIEIPQRRESAPPPAPAPCNRVLVFASEDGTRTRTYPWPADLPAPLEVAFGARTFRLVADSRVMDGAA